MSGLEQNTLFLVASFIFLGFAGKLNWKLFLNYKYQVGGQLGTVKYDWNFTPDCYSSRYRQPCWTFSRILIIHNQRTIWRYFTGFVLQLKQMNRWRLSCSEHTLKKSFSQKSFKKSGSNKVWSDTVFWRCSGTFTGKYLP